ncbi:MAG: hypothetical protein ACJA2W_000054 [Planctomycetota bacterium]|jgi:hypothetical protein
MRTLSYLTAAALVAVVATDSAAAQCSNPISGPDVIVGGIPNISNYGELGGMAAYSLGTTSCNVGDTELLWFANNTNHPVIGQNIYRLEEGRFEQLGMSWLKHGFTALQQNLCCSCNSSGTGSRLGVGCSDPYGSGLNGSQGGLGPRFQVNAFTGAFSYPFAQQGQSGDRVFKRIQVPVADVLAANHPTARYFGEAQYITPDDAASGNGFNNTSWVPLNRNSAGSGLSIGGATNREEAAVYAYAQAEPTVLLSEVNVPSEGQFLVASNAINLGNGAWRYEYAIFNNNSDFSGQSFSVDLGTGNTVISVGHSFPMYHSGEPYTNASWNETVTTDSVTWSTESFIMNQDANALRWGTTYSFWFTTNAAPVSASATIGLFKPGNPGDQLADVQSPGDATGGAIITESFCESTSNSTGVKGVLVLAGFDLVGRTIDLEATKLPLNAFGFFIVSMVQDVVPNAGGSAGTLCLGGAIGRGVAGGVFDTGVTGTVLGSVDLDMIPTPTSTTAAMSGQTWNFQAWHRDTILSFSTSNFTNGISVQFF